MWNWFCSISQASQPGKATDGTTRPEPKRPQAHAPGSQRPPATKAAGYTGQSRKGARAKHAPRVAKTHYHEGQLATKASATRHAGNTCPRVTETHYHKGCRPQGQSHPDMRATHAPGPRRPTTTKAVVHWGHSHQGKRATHAPGPLRPTTKEPKPYEDWAPKSRPL